MDWGGAHGGALATDACDCCTFALPQGFDPHELTHLESGALPRAASCQLQHTHMHASTLLHAHCVGEHTDVRAASTFERPNASGRELHGCNNQHLAQL